MMGTVWLIVIKVNLGWLILRVKVKTKTKPISQMRKLKCRSYSSLHYLHKLD